MDNSLIGHYLKNYFSHIKTYFSLYDKNIKENFELIQSSDFKKVYSESPLMKDTKPIVFNNLASPSNNNINGAIEQNVIDGKVKNENFNRKNFTNQFKKIGKGSYLQPDKILMSSCFK